MFFFKYKAHWDFDGKEVIDNGLIYGESFADAVRRLEEWYGEDLIELTIEWVGERGEPYVFEGKDEEE